MTGLVDLTDIEYSSIIHDLISTLPILRDLLHLLQLLRRGVGLRKDQAHLVPTLTQLLVADLILYRKFFEIFIELLSLLLEVLLGVFCHLAQVKRISGLVLLYLK